MKCVLAEVVNFRRPISPSVSCFLSAELLDNNVVSVAKDVSCEGDPFLIVIDDIINVILVDTGAGAP